MTLYDHWIERNFQVHHTPGISRSLVRIEDNGEHFLLTDVGGYDVPSTNGPFQIMHFSAT